MEGKKDDVSTTDGSEEKEQTRESLANNVTNPQSITSTKVKSDINDKASHEAVAEPEGTTGSVHSAAKSSKGQLSETLPDATSEHVVKEGSKRTLTKSDLDVTNEILASTLGNKKKISHTEFPTNTFVGCLGSSLPNFENFSCSKFIANRSPFIRNPPEPEERRSRIEQPRTPRDYIVNLREDLADFQEIHGLPRTRDYSFMSLGLALAQETARAICSVFLMFSELFPVVAIISLVLRFALDKLIDILETHEPVPKLKKSLIFGLQMVMILIPLWILLGTIVLPLANLLLSIFTKFLRVRGGKTARCGHPKKQVISTSGKK